MKCLTPGCNKDVHARDLCHSCNNAARRAIKAGKATWDELVLLGLASATSEEVKARGAFSRGLAEARAKSERPLPTRTELSLPASWGNLDKSFNAFLSADPPATKQKAADPEVPYWPGPTNAETGNIVPGADGIFVVKPDLSEREIPQEFDIVPSSPVLGFADAPPSVEQAVPDFIAPAPLDSVIPPDVAAPSDAPWKR